MLKHNIPIDSFYLQNLKYFLNIECESLEKKIETDSTS